MNFGIILTQFYINFSRQEHQIKLSWVAIKSYSDQLSAYTPFHFSFTVPLSSKKRIFKYQGRIQGGGRECRKIPIYSPIKFYNEEGCSLKSIYKNLLQLFSLLSEQNALLFSVINIENRIYREELKESLGMDFFSPFQPEREFKVYKSCKCSQIIWNLTITYLDNVL